MFFLACQAVWGSIMTVSDLAMHFSHYVFSINTCIMLRSFNGLEPGGPTMIESKGERKRLIFLGLHRKPIKSLTQGLLCSRRPQALSLWGEGTERLLERVLEAQAGK